MKTILTAGLAALLMAATAWAGPLKLEPADPQPSGLKQGLSVSYAYPGSDIKSLAAAEKALKKAKPGTPLAGFDYRDTNDGDLTLTSERAHNVAARITGFIRFDAPGIYDMDFLSNDGLQVHIGGQEVTFFDGRHPCDNAGAVEVEVPVAGWYPLEAVYFQRLGTACLHMKAGPSGKKMKWVKDEIFGY